MNKSEQLNMQIPELDKAMEKLRQMTLLDDFLFDVVTENLENCKIIIELSMGIRIRELVGGRDRKLFIIFRECVGFVWIFMLKIWMEIFLM